MYRFAKGYQDSAINLEIESSNKRVQGTRHKVSGPLTRDVRRKIT